VSLDLGAIIGNVASGGILGLVGSIGTGIVSIFQAKNQYAHDERMAALEMQRIGAQSDADAKKSADQLKLELEEGADKSFQASQLAASAINNVPPVIAGLLALWRPILTAALTVFAGCLYPHSDGPTQIFITQVAVQSWSAAIMWWFGSRQMLQFVPAKNTGAAPAAGTS